MEDSTSHAAHAELVDDWEFLGGSPTAAAAGAGDVPSAIKSDYFSALEVVQNEPDAAEPLPVNELADLEQEIDFEAIAAEILQVLAADREKRRQPLVNYKVSRGGAFRRMEKRKEESAFWWKHPLDVVTKYCGFKLRPFWTISVAAALVGLVMVGRKAHQMRRRTRSLASPAPPPRIAFEKKSSQDDRATHINEAFSTAFRGIPFIRASQTAASIIPWSPVR